MADVNNSAPAGADEVADPGATGFCAEAWQRGADIRDAVVGMPFVTQLADGSLAKEAFRHYLIQDSFYLRAYSRALSIASSKAHTPNAQVCHRLLRQPCVADCGATHHTGITRVAWASLHNPRKRVLGEQGVGKTGGDVGSIACRVRQELRCGERRS
jgi:hypothetical protein